MADEDDGWGGTVDEGWMGPSGGAGPAGPPPYQAPPHMPPTAPPGRSTAPNPGGTPPPGGWAGTTGPAAGSYAGGPGGGGYRPPAQSNRKWIIVAIVAVVVVAGAAVGIVIGTTGSGSNASTTTLAPVVTTTGGNTSSTTAGTPTTTNTTAGSEKLLSESPFTGCEAVNPSGSNPPATAALECGTGSNVSSVNANYISYGAYSAANLQAWYETLVVGDNGITNNSGNCSTDQLVPTTKGANLCEGAFTDDTGTAARETIVVAPLSLPVTVGEPVTAICGTSGDYTFLAFTSPSDDIAVLVLACNGTEAANFESSLKDGDFDLND